MTPAMLNHWRFGAAVLTALVAANTEASEWGRHATLAPGWERVRQSAINAARHPMTWMPAVAATGVFVSGQDERWAKELHDDPPVFGDARKAGEQSDRFRLGAELLWKASMLVTDSGDSVRAKTKGIVVQVAAVNATHAVSNELKRHVDRAEPGFTDEEEEGDAFPSNHATDAFAHAALIRENMKSSSLPKPVAVGMVGAGYIAASGSAWGRVEAGAHHVSDQLMGAAMGNFVATFINEAFMGGESVLRVGYAPSGQWSLGIAFNF